MLHTHSVLIKSPPSIQYVIYTSQQLLISKTLLLGLFSYDIVLPKVAFVCLCVYLCVAEVHLHVCIGCARAWLHVSVFASVLVFSEQCQSDLFCIGWTSQPWAEFDNGILYNAQAECLVICDTVGVVHFYSFMSYTVKKPAKLHIGILPLWHYDK